MAIVEACAQQQFSIMRRPCAGHTGFGSASTPDNRGVVPPRVGKEQEEMRVKEREKDHDRSAARLPRLLLLLCYSQA